MIEDLQAVLNTIHRAAQYHELADRADSIRETRGFRYSPLTTDLRNAEAKVNHLISRIEYERHLKTD